MIDYCKDKAKCAIIIGEMVQTQGWKLVKDFIAREMENSIYRLQKIDPTDSLNISKHQNIIKNYTALLNFVESCISKKQED